MSDWRLRSALTFVFAITVALALREGLPVFFIVAPLAGFLILLGRRKTVTLPWLALVLTIPSLLFTGAPTPLQPAQMAALLNPSDPRNTLTLLEVTSNQGIPAALKRLAEMVEADSRVGGNNPIDSHSLAHAIGAFAILSGVPPRQAYQSCERGFGWGCYHGVIQQFLPNYGRLSLEAVPHICEDDLQAQTIFRGQLECQHGLGHAFAQIFHDDLTKSLDFCDRLAAGDPRSQCGSGVFMEHTQTARQALRLNTNHAMLDRADPFYPCGTVPDRYAYSCYESRGPMLIQLLGRDWPKLFALCETLGEKNRPPCWQSIGSQLHGDNPTEAKIREAFIICEGAGIKGRPYCLVSLVGLDVLSPELVAEICEMVRATDQAAGCFSRYGERLALTIPQLDLRRQLCLKTAREYVPSCERGTTRNAPAFEPDHYKDVVIRLSGGAVSCQCDPELAAQLLRQVDTAGVAATLSAAEVARVQKGFSPIDTHSIGHWIGQYAYERTNNHDALADACTQAAVDVQFRIGCVHGIGVGFIGAYPNLQPAQVTLACKGSSATPDCWHGVGHALVQRFGIDLEKVLRYCDAVPALDGSVECGSSVYMESGALARNPSSPGADSFLKSDDLGYPCTAAPARYRDGCWGIHPWSLHAVFKGDWNAIAQVCLTAGESARTCADGSGRKMAAEGLSPSAIKTSCSNFGPYTQACTQGALPNNQ